MAQGHSHTAILGYTLAQFWGYMDCGGTRAARLRRERFEDMALAFGGGEPFMQRLQEMSDLS